MALISFDNFLAPFRNKGQLITIIVIIFVFAVFRWEGGGVEVRQNPNGRSPDQDSSYSSDGSTIEDIDSPQDYVKPKEHFLDEMMADDIADDGTSQNPEASPGTAENEDPNSLDELERMVGLK